MKVSLQKGNLGLSLEVEKLEGKELDFILGILKELAKPEYGPLIPMVGIDGLQLRQPAPFITFPQPEWVGTYESGGYVRTNPTTVDQKKLCGHHYMVNCNCLEKK